MKLTKIFLLSVFTSSIVTQTSFATHLENVVDSHDEESFLRYCGSGSVPSFDDVGGDVDVRFIPTGKFEFWPHPRAHAQADFWPHLGAYAQGTEEGAAPESSQKTKALYFTSTPFLIETWLKGGADVNARNRTGETPIHYAAKRGDRGAVETLRAMGADITVMTNTGATPADYARNNGHEELASYLEFR